MKNEFIQSMRSRKVDPKIVTKFLSKFEQLGDNDCWLWTGARMSIENMQGAGRFYINRCPDISMSAPRVQWELLVGALDRYSLVALDCEHRNCMNPLHMRIKCRGYSYKALKDLTLQRWVFQRVK